MLERDLTRISLRYWRGGQLVQRWRLHMEHIRRYAEPSVPTVTHSSGSYHKFTPL